MTSLEIAEVTGKQHFHVMEAIRKMESTWERITASNFRLGNYKYEGRGLAQDRLFIYYSKEGKQKERTYLVWTQKGADFISNLVN